MASEYIRPPIRERPDLAHETHDYDSEYRIEHYSSAHDRYYRKWASKQQFISLVKSLNALDLPSAQHIEDIQNISADDMIPIFNLDQINNTTATVPELLISNPSSPSDNHSNYTWGNADDIPTRVPSAALEDFPPLVRCRNDPAMGYPDDFINDLHYGDNDSVLSDWCFYSHLNVDQAGPDGIRERDSQNSSMSSCKEQRIHVAESKDDESWAYISPASSAMSLLPPCSNTVHVYDDVPSNQ